MKRTVKHRENTFKPAKTKTKATTKQESNEKKDLPGYPLYPAEEDIYKQSIKENIDPDDVTSAKKENEVDAEAMNEKSFEEDYSGEDLDVPGSELDDQQEEIGSEDEENNYYSLGGDNHDE